MTLEVKVHLDGVLPKNDGLIQERLLPRLEWEHDAVSVYNTGSSNGMGICP